VTVGVSVPSSLLMAADDTPMAVPAIGLPEAVRTMTRTPAAVVRSVWRSGARVA
jgi:hypothetical protein